MEGIELGHHISFTSIRVDSSKVYVITEFPIAYNQLYVRSFLGYVGYYHRFIKEFSKKALQSFQ